MGYDHAYTQIEHAHMDIDVQNELHHSAYLSPWIGL